MQVNAAFLLIESTQNLLQFDGTCCTDNQMIIKSYENAVAFFKLFILRMSDIFCTFAVEYVGRLSDQSANLAE